MCNENPAWSPSAATEQDPQDQVIPAYRETVRTQALQGMEPAAVVPYDGTDYISMT
jgi:hypothetical protein